MTHNVSIPMTHAENIKLCLELLERKYPEYAVYWIEQNFTKPWEFTCDATARGYHHRITLDIHNVEIYSIVGLDQAVAS